MAENLKTSQRTDADALNGSELVDVVQGGLDRKTTVQAIANKGNFEAAGAAAAVASSLSTHTSNTNNPHSVTKSQVGLGNVDNTSDVDKPVSTAQAAALENKIDVIGSYETILLSGTGYATPVWSLDNRGDEENGTLNITSGALTLQSIATLILSAPTIRLFGGIEQRAFVTSLIFDNDHDLATVTGGARSFTVSGGGTHHNGVSIVAKLNTPASVSFSSDFIEMSGSDTIDITKMNIIVFRYFNNYDGLGGDKVLYSVKNQDAL
jgi:hypothetical protein